MRIAMPHNMVRQTVSWALVAVLGLSSTTSHAIAFCALRDPTHQIYDLYPQATGYRSLVSRVERQVRDDVGASLPFTLHNREIGQHTLYVALAEEQPLGLVHVRSESSNWGLIEIVWSLNLDLKIRDFRFQRCRDSACAALVEEPFKSFLQGKTMDELRELIGEDGRDIDVRALPVTASQQALAAAVLRSALKTILVTKLVWGRELAALG